MLALSTHASIQHARICYTPVIRPGDLVTISPPYRPKPQPGKGGFAEYVGPFEVLRVADTAGITADGRLYSHKCAYLHIPGKGRGHKFPLTRLERA